ncbi:transposase [Nocardia sp. NPDC050193]
MGVASLFGIDEVVRYSYRLRPGRIAERALFDDSSFRVEGRGRPRVKARRKTLPSLEYTRRGFGLRGGRLVLAKGISIPVVWSRELPSEPTSVRITQDSLGHWYASFVVTREIGPLPDADGGIGVDWRVAQTATTTDERFDLPHRGYRKRCAAALAKSQRKMSRRRGGKGKNPSKGYQQARAQAARLQEKAARQNEHEARVWAKSVVAEHQVITVEDFRPQFLAKSRMARKAADAAIGMTCSGCFARAKQHLGLGERIFRCAACGYSGCRDRNAARVILAVAERGHTGVDDVSHVDHLLRDGGAVAV